MRESTLALKPRADVTRSPKQGYQWPHKKDLCPTKNLLKKKKIKKKKKEKEKKKGWSSMVRIGEGGGRYCLVVLMGGCFVLFFVIH